MTNLVVLAGVMGFVAGMCFYGALIEWGTRKGYTIYEFRDKEK